MRVSEAQWIARSLAQHRLESLVNIGSSTAEFRERRQPHIDRLIFAPLRARGVAVIHSDLKHAPGVDIAGDLLDPGVQAELARRRPSAVLSSNLLEHVRERERFATALTALLQPGGVLVVTVPRSYPFHADPIDTGYRPTPEELASLFSGTRLLSGEVVADTTYLGELRRRGPRRALRALLGALRPNDVGRTQRESLRWLAKPFTTTCVVLERV